MIKEEIYERYFCEFAEDLSNVFNFYKEKIFSKMVNIGEMPVKGKENINKLSVTRELNYIYTAIIWILICSELKSI